LFLVQRWQIESWWRTKVSAIENFHLIRPDEGLLLLQRASNAAESKVLTARSTVVCSKLQSAWRFSFRCCDPLMVEGDDCAVEDRQ